MITYYIIRSSDGGEYWAWESAQLAREALNRYIKRGFLKDGRVFALRLDVHTDRFTVTEET